MKKISNYLDELLFRWCNKTRIRVKTIVTSDGEKTVLYIPEFSCLAGAWSTLTNPYIIDAYPKYSEKYAKYVIDLWLLNRRKPWFTKTTTGYIKYP